MIPSAPWPTSSPTSNDDLEAGGGLSGPAARSAIKAAACAPRFEGTVTNATTARRLLTNDNAPIYDNPQALLQMASPSAYLYLAVQKEAGG
ncbi:hypothetical protein ADL04_32875 [Streptomyces sp. NRRL B-3648]|nr:hypothetical protein ADL04_32875 [Streptomyces sp. NRRL B-3648]